MDVGEEYITKPITESEERCFFSKRNRNISYERKSSSVGGQAFPLNVLIEQQE